LSNSVHGPVPKELDRQMVREIIGERKAAVTADPNLLLVERWDHSDVFYEVRTRLAQQGYDVRVYGSGNESDRRKKLYAMIKPVCENDFKVKRHQVGIFPKDRAVMAFQGEIHNVNFDNLLKLMGRGTDVIIVEKQGTVIKLLPFTESNGIAFIQAEGFVTEYGLALGRISMGGDECHDYTDGYVPMHKGHLGVLTDCDARVIIG
jgi:hypothetical protein